MTTILPPPLKAGDTIGLFSPAGPVRDLEPVKTGISLLLQQGFSVRSLSPLTETDNPDTYLAASDSARAEELGRLVQDRNIHALMAVRGGYGCLRLLSLIDWQLLRDMPKYLIGFSDISNLLLANLACNSLIGLHAPVLTTLAATSAQGRETFFYHLQGSFATLPLTGAVRVIRGGTARGQILPVNLTCLLHLLETQWLPELHGALLFIEDTGESMYRLDRMLTRLAMSDGFRHLGALILGSFDTGKKEETADKELQKKVEQRLAELADDTSFPIWSGFPLGHTPQNISLPCGMEATLTSDPAQLIFHPPD